MSLINEALKRTRDASYAGGPASAPSSSGYQLAPARGARTPGAWPWVMAITVVGGLAAAAYHFFAVEPAATTITANQPVAAVTAAETAATATPADDPVRAAEDALLERLMVRLQETPAATASAPTMGSSATTVTDQATVAEPQAATAVAEPLPPPLRLQGIMQDHGSFEAMINGYNYRVGDELVEGGRVTRIESRTVGVMVDGREIELRLR